MGKTLVNGKIPVYVGVYNSLYSDITNGVYLENECLPGEGTLAKQYGVSRNTLRQALAILSEDGLIVRSQGRGTLVAPRRGFLPTREIQNPHTNLCKKQIDDMRIQYNYGPPTDIARAKLGLNNSDIILASDIVYLAQGKVVGYSFTQVPTAVFPDMDLDTTQDDAVEQLMTSRIFEYATHWSLTVKLAYANEVEIEFLQVEEGTPLILIEAILYDSAPKPFARCKFYFLPDNYHLQFFM